jgi:hypothetical protein
MYESELTKAENEPFTELELKERRPRELLN